MRFLYGDSTLSPLTSNVLEFLRDAIDFSVFVLEADERIRASRSLASTLRLRADADIEELEALGRTVVATIEATPKRSADSPAVPCAAAMATSCNDTVGAAVDAVRSRLREEIAQAEAAEASERDASVKALMGLLSPHEPPASAVVLRARLREDGASYEASLAGHCPALDLKWRMELGFPEGNLLAQPIRVDRLASPLEIQAPELTGWIKKEVKIRPQRVDGHAITEAVSEGSTIIVCLRTEPSSDAGFDVEVDIETGKVSASRVVPGEDRSAGPFDVAEADAPKLLEVGKRLHAALAELGPLRLVEARLGEVDFRDAETFVDVVRRIVDQLAPIVHDVATHSLEPSELVLRRQLGNGRREEIYIARATLREKYERLPPELRRLFEPLGLHTSLSRSIAPAVPPESAVRSELAPSRPPPPPGAPVAAVAPPAPKAPSFPEASPSTPPADESRQES